MIHFIEKVKAGLIFLCALLPSLLNAQQEEKPNLLVILTDQWRGQALGFEGREPVLTPVLDEFAGQSLVLQQAVANYPLCSPSRAMFLTGRYPFKNQVYSNVNSKSTPYNVELPADMTCWSDVLKAQGYSNGYIGKWHLDSPRKPYVNTSNNTDRETAWNEWTPPSRRHGFDYWYAYGTYDIHDHPMYWDTKAGRNDFHYVNEWGPIHETEKAIAFLKNEKGQYRGNGKPFSLVVSMNPPHSGYTSVPEKYYSLYKNIPIDSFLNAPDIPPAGTPMGDHYRKNIKYYYANITGVDEQIGRILKSLKENGLEENTIVVFMADHGNLLGRHQEVSKNIFYEESVRIPLIIHWKNKIQSCMDNRMLISMPDLFPTLLELMGMPEKIPVDVDGRSFASYFKTGAGKPADEQFLLGAVAASNKNSGFRALRTAEYKLVYQRKNKQLQTFLFDLKNDPFELQNIYTDKPHVVRAMLPRLQFWLDKTNDSFQLNP